MSNLIPETATVPSSEKLIYDLTEVTDDRELFGGKMVNLARIARAGLLVPETKVITTDHYLNYLQSGEINAEVIAEIIRLREEYGGAIALRSSANIEDGSELSMSGVFKSYYIRAEDDEDAIRSKLEAIYKSARSREVANTLSLHGKSAEEVKMAVIIQRLIEPKYAGVVYAGHDSGQTIVQYIDDYGENFVDGNRTGAMLVMDAQSGVITSSRFTDLMPVTEGEAEQLNSNAARLVETFNDIPQDVEFVIESGTDRIFIVQSRTLTKDISQLEAEITELDVLSSTKNKLKKLAAAEKGELGLEQAIFSNSNFIELLPRPKCMDIGIFAYIFTGSNNRPGAIQLGRREMGYTVGDETVGYMHYIGGRPYISIARDAGTYYYGVPEERSEYYHVLVADYLRQITQNTELGLYPEMKLYVQNPTFSQLQELFPGSAERYFQQYLDFKANLAAVADQFLDEFQYKRLPDMEEFYRVQAGEHLAKMDDQQLVQYLNTNLEYLRTNACVDFVKAARLGFYYLQRLYAELAENLNLDENEVQKYAAVLTQGLPGSRITEVNMAIAVAGNEEEALKIAAELIGHFSIGEALEIRHPRFTDQPEAMQAYVRGLRDVGDYAHRFEQQRQARISFEQQLLEHLPESSREQFQKVLANTQKYLALRETVKYYFLKGYAYLRSGLTELANRNEVSEAEIFQLYPDEILAFTENPLKMRHKLKARENEYQHYYALELPDVIRESDIAGIDTFSDKINGFTEAHGRFIAAGEVVEEAVIINLEELDPEKEDIQAIIDSYAESGLRIVLAANQVNLTHDPYIFRAAGMVLAHADMASHGAQRARELGTGAIAGIDIRRLKTGIKVFFDPTNRYIKRIES